MKRPPGIWILLSAGVLWLCFQDVYAIRATALIFGKSTTTTPPTPVTNATDGLSSEVVTEASSESSNVTKATLTGIPQIDYIHDPNLPKELNGYNLSEYPFYERVPDPDEIDFKCDGLHDGFYASIPFKCQVYHHCLFGTRYDFLCANYTAFDQKTFICQFVSDVDCIGSKKFWHRNDALYQAATTTTQKPLNIYTPPPGPNPGNGEGGTRGNGKRRIRPLARRPQYDYFDYADYDEDYYDDRPRPRRRKQRPRPRPVYEDEYEDEYEEEVFERRNRRPYNRRGGSERRRNKNRNKHRDKTPDEEIERDRKKPAVSEEEEEQGRHTDRRKPIDDDVYDRRNPVRSDESRPVNSKRKPQRHEEEDDEKVRKPSRDESSEEDFERESPRRTKPTRRPIIEDEYDDDNSRSRPRKQNPEYSSSKTQTNKVLIVPTTGTIYDRPRVAPRIKPPVPKNEAGKYAYKPISKSTTATPVEYDDYYEEYDEEILPPKISKSRNHQTISSKLEPSETKGSKQASIASQGRTKSKLNEEEEASTLIQNSKPKNDVSRGKDRYRSRTSPKTIEKTYDNKKNKSGNQSTEKPLEVEYYDDDYEIVKTTEETKVSNTEAARKKWKPSTASVESSTTTVKSQAENAREHSDQIVRVVKRPFLPSRGGNPYSSRGLQPVGFKATKSEVMEQQGSADVKKIEEPLDIQSQSNKKGKVENNRDELTSTNPFVKSRFSEPISKDDDNFKPMKRPQHILRTNYDGSNYSGPRTTQRPKVPEINPLDIVDNEYDVTLNDALNPTIPNLPSGFNPANDYTFTAFQRPRYVIETPNSDFVYHSKQPITRQRFEPVPQSYNSNGFKTYYAPSVPNGNAKRAISQTQPYPYYTTNY